MKAILFALTLTATAASPISLAQQTQKEVLQDSEKGASLYTSCMEGVRMLDHPAAKDLDLFGAGSCVAYVAAFRDALSITDKKNVCDDHSLSVGTVVRLYIAYMAAHPRLMDEYKSVGLYVVFRNEFPCKT